MGLHNFVHKAEQSSFLPEASRIVEAKDFLKSPFQKSNQNSASTQRRRLTRRKRRRRRARSRMSWISTSIEGQEVAFLTINIYRYRESTCCPGHVLKLSRCFSCSAAATPLAACEQWTSSSTSTSAAESKKIILWTVQVSFHWIVIQSLNQRANGYKVALRTPAHLG